MSNHRAAQAIGRNAQGHTQAGLKSGTFVAHRDEELGHVSRLRENRLTVGMSVVSFLGPSGPNIVICVRFGSSKAHHSHTGTRTDSFSNITNNTF
jgi:hypothetical protein